MGIERNGVEVMSQGSNQQHGQKSGYITAPILDLIIYTPRLRAIISDLKENNDFRPEGLRLLHRLQIGIFIFSLFFALPIFLFAEEYIYAPYVIIFVFIIANAQNSYVIINRFIVPYSIGAIVIGKIIDVAYDAIPIYTRGWDISYEFCIGENRLIKNRIANIGKKNMGQLRPSKVKSVYVFYSKGNPENNTIYVPGIFQKCCVSRARFKKYQHLGEVG